MKNYVEIGHLTRYDAFRVNRDQVMDLEIRFKIHRNVSNINFEKASPKTILTLKFFYQFCDNCKILSCTFYLKEDHNDHNDPSIYPSMKLTCI